MMKFIARWWMLPVVVFVLAGALGVPGAIGAKPPKGPKPNKAANAPARERMKDVLKELDLTAEQKEKLQGIMQEQKAKTRELGQHKAAGGTGRKEQRQALRKLREESAPKLKEILTSEQYAKWQKHQEEAGRTGGKKKQ